MRQCKASEVACLVQTVQLNTLVPTQLFSKKTRCVSFSSADMNPLHDSFPEPTSLFRHDTTRRVNTMQGAQERTPQQSSTHSHAQAQTRTFSIRRKNLAFSSFPNVRHLYSASLLSYISRTPPLVFSQSRHPHAETKAPAKPSLGFLILTLVVFNTTRTTYLALSQTILGSP